MTVSPRMSNEMTLDELFAGLGVAAPALAITDITSNSHRVLPGGLFLACAGGTHHGAEFIGEALARGAAAVAWEPAIGLTPPVLPGHVSGLEIPGLRHRLGVIADRFFGQPSAMLPVTGVTGTNGKSTVAFLLAQALTHLGRRAGYMGTLGYGLGS